MAIGGVSIILILGLVNLALLFFQLTTGMHWVRVPIKTHRTSGIILVISSIIHGGLAILARAL
jgi:hypothetical protein